MGYIYFIEKNVPKLASITNNATSDALLNALKKFWSFQRHTINVKYYKITLKHDELTNIPYTWKRNVKNTYAGDFPVIIILF